MRSGVSGRRLSVLLLAMVGCTEDGAGGGGPLGKVHAEVSAVFAATDVARVIVDFRDPGGPHQLAQHRAAISRAGSALAAAHADGFRVVRSFHHLPAVAGYVSAGELARLDRDPNVTSIEIDHPGGGALKVAVPAIGGDKARSTFGVSGKGVRVAVLDTGVNTSHVDLRAAVVPTQHCFTQSACLPGDTSEGTSAEDDNGHGSNVAGIVASAGIAAGAGFAPGAELVAVKVDDAQDRGFESDWAAGLDWIFENLATLKVRIVNMSLVTDAQYATEAACDAAEPAFAQAVKNLTDAGVVVFASAGNDGSTTGIDAPACLTGVIAVGATYKSAQGPQPAGAATYRDAFGSSFSDCADTTTAFDQITCFSNSTSRVDVVAPGAVIVSDYVGGTTALSNYWGTSQASPAAAGVAALMLECNPQLTPAAVKDLLQRTGVPLTDPRNGLSVPSIRALAAVQAACGASDAGAGPTDGGSAGAAGAGSPDAGRAGAGDGGAAGQATANGGAGSSGGTQGGTTGGQAGLALPERGSGGGCSCALAPLRPRELATRPAMGWLLAAVLISRRRRPR